jgi:hypothetical protein
MLHDLVCTASGRCAIICYFSLLELALVQYNLQCDPPDNPLHNISATN